MNYLEIMKKPYEEWTEEEKAYSKEVTQGAIRAAKGAAKAIRDAFQALGINIKKTMILRSKRKRGHKNALVAYPSPIQVKRKRKRAIKKVTDQRYWKAIQQAEDKGDYVRSAELFIEYMDKVAGD